MSHLSATVSIERPAAAGLAAEGAALGDGEAREALRIAMHQLSQVEADAGPGRPAAMCHALTEAARALAGLHAYGPAESYLGQALRWAGQMGGQDLSAELECAWAEVATNAADLAEHQDDTPRSRAARERARDHAFEAARLARRTTDPNWEIRVLLRASDVLERCGDNDDAVQLQQRAMLLMGLAPADADGEAQSTSTASPFGHCTAPGLLM